MINDRNTLFTRLVAQTARIRWHELQRFFAQGRVLYVAQELELPEIANSIAQDSVASVKKLLDSGQLALVEDHQAKQWHQQDTELWAVVVAPYVLVQTIEA